MRTVRTPGRSVSQAADACGRRLKVDTNKESKGDAAALIGAFILGDRDRFQAVLDQIAAAAGDDTELADHLANMLVDLAVYAHPSVSECHPRRRVPVGQLRNTQAIGQLGVGRRLWRSLSAAAIAGAGGV
jgi:hypothetical protein